MKTFASIVLGVMSSCAAAQAGGLARNGVLDAGALWFGLSLLCGVTAAFNAAARK